MPGKAFISKMGKDMLRWSQGDEAMTIVLIYGGYKSIIPKLITLHRDMNYFSCIWLSIHHIEEECFVQMLQVLPKSTCHVKWKFFCTMNCF